MNDHKNQPDKTIYPIIRPYGEYSILLQWNPEISVKTHQEILMWEFALKQNPQIMETFSSFHELLLVYQTIIRDFEVEKENILKEAKQFQSTKGILSKCIEIPVCYEKRFGYDQEDVCRLLNINEEELIMSHASREYRVFMIGFLPGFPYMGFLPEKFRIGRKSDPRKRVEAGSVGIAANMTGIYPVVSPGGWHIIASTPVPVFFPQEKVPCLLNQGDRVVFRPIEMSEYEQMAFQVSQGTFNFNSLVR
ncbi:MAG TPA: 5-oxoprolinase subunit PxpB [Saprospiraceae bacterium]|nr:5-oxoprolinase subunit PxpB [Saprospiraceae bacterium]